MKNTMKVTILGLLAVLCSFAQLSTVLQTSTSAAVTATAKSFAVASATGISAPVSNTAPGSSLYVVDIGQKVGELMTVTGVSSTTITVRRGGPGKATAHASGAAVFVATDPSWFITSNPSGSCTTAQTYSVPAINVMTGDQWYCSSQTLTWVPGWGNTVGGGAQVITATATASVAGATAIIAPLVHISGTNAITSFTMATGWNGQGFCIVPDAAFTTTATNNIAIATTAVLNKTLCYTYDAKNSKFTASY